MKNTQIPFLAGMVLIGCLGLGGCQLTESRTSLTHAPLTGRLVYVVSDDVREYDLASGKRRVLFRHDGLLSPPLIDVDGTRFIVKRFLTGGMFLVGMDGQAHELGKGSDYEFFPAHGKLLYLTIPPGQSQSYPLLHEATLRENRLESPRVAGGGPITSGRGRSILAISDDEALMERYDEGYFINRRYTIYDLRTGLFTDLDFSRETCRAMAWRTRTQELICADPNGWALYSLDGRRTPIPGLRKRKFAIAVYVPQGDYVLGGGWRWSWKRGEIIDLHSYHFSTGGARRVAKRISVGGGNAFWLPPRSAAEQERFPK